jgi:exosortase
LPWRAGAVVALSLTPLLISFFVNLWSREPYQFFPLALAGAGFLAWQRFQSVARPLAIGTWWVTGALLSLSLLMLACGTLLWSPWLGALAGLVALAGGVWGVGGWALFRAMLPAAVLLLTIIPPPLGLDARLTLKLRALAVGWSGKTLDLLGVTHQLAGNIIEIPGRRLLVEEACSGINSVLFVSVAALFYMLWQRRSLLHLAVAVVLAVSFVLLGNVGRITAGAWLGYRYHLDILAGWRHEAVGLVLLAAYLGLILSLDQMLVFVAECIPRRQKRNAAPEHLPTPPPTAAGGLLASARRRSSLGDKRADQGNEAGGTPVPLPFRGWAGAGHPTSSRWAWAAAIAFGVLGLAQIVVGWNHHHQTELARKIPASALRAGASFSLPEQIGAWQRLAGPAPDLQKVETLGVFSQIWHFQRGNLVASVALDYPFRGYHDVTICYTAQGWRMTQRSRLPTHEANLQIPHEEVQMRQGTLKRAWLWFSTVDERGLWQEQKSRVRRGFMERFKTETGQPTTYRVQMLVTGYVPLEPAQRDEARKFFEAARNLVAVQLLRQMSPN